jgi:hypothetical protein
MTNWPSDDAVVRRALARLAAEESAVVPSPRLEQRVMAAWDAAHAPVAGARARPWRTWWPMAATVVLTLGALTGLMMFRTAVDMPRAERRSIDDAGDVRPAVFAIVDAIADGEPLTTVRLEVPIEQLNRVGINPQPGVRTAVLELLVGDDGVARSARILF